jgi:tRNA U38,U39,U40 pseudouridine synthase TruA
MVRSLVGQLVAIGLGHSSVAELRILLTTPDRHRAADPAPGKGLCLIGVEYGHGESQPGCTVDDEEGS